MNYLDDTIAAISTPIGQGGIGIVRISGPGALRIADTLFQHKKRDHHLMRIPACYSTVMSLIPLATG